MLLFKADPELRIVKKRFKVFSLIIVLLFLLACCLILASCRGYFVHVNSNVKVGKMKDSIVLVVPPPPVGDTIPPR